jgi:putative oxidoreductase
MNILTASARYLLGFLFLVSGLNGFLHFIPMGTMPTGLAGQFVVALMQSHYMVVVFLLELVPALMLLANRYVPLALTLLAPVIVNILLFHVFLEPTGLPMAILVAVLWVVSAYRFRSTFGSLVVA